MKQKRIIANFSPSFLAQSVSQHITADQIECCVWNATTRTLKVFISVPGSMPDDSIPQAYAIKDKRPICSTYETGRETDVPAAALYHPPTGGGKVSPVSGALPQRRSSLSQTQDRSQGARTKKSRFTQAQTPSSELRRSQPEARRQRKTIRESKVKGPKSHDGARRETISQTQKTISKPAKNEAPY